MQLLHAQVAVAVQLHQLLLLNLLHQQHLHLLLTDLTIVPS
ncbi:MAG: hypothetical protein ACK50J_09240 [Planctomyces sp.]